ncbi:hypothetical protein [Parapedobacter tibetensis]|uniref:hypothetical protein n=1 Tax=Parapedobacter tibetensis TaxID=2972951 RepID=UPI00214DD352|nr:hypothetical protein [Parapedobacter tibetensis]
MKLILDIKDDKVPFFLEVLKNFKFVKAEPLSSNKSAIIDSMKQAVKEMNLVSAGKLEARDADDFLNELQS